MNQKTLDALEQLGREQGLRLDRNAAVLYGMRNGYQICISYQNTQNHMLGLQFSVAKDGQLPDGKELSRACKAEKTLFGCTVSRYQVVFLVKSAMGQEKTIARAGEALDAAIRILHTNRYQNCCQNCGGAVSTQTDMVCGTPMHLCEACFTSLGNSAQLREQEQKQKKENVLGGIVGALIGSLLGVVAIILFSQLGYVSALSGVILAVCTLKGYELLGGRLSRKGVVISVILMLIMAYVGDRADWAIVVMRSFEDVDFFTAFEAVPYLLQNEAIESGAYITNLLLVYLFAIAGAVPILLGKRKAAANQNLTYPMR